MCDKYRELNPEKHLPVLEYENGTKDRSLLEMLISRNREKEAKLMLVKDHGKRFGRLY